MDNIWIGETFSSHSYSIATMIVNYIVVNHIDTYLIPTHHPTYQVTTYIHYIYINGTYLTTF
jgi:hypothetical protein